MGCDAPTMSVPPALFPLFRFPCFPPAKTRRRSRAAPLVRLLLGFLECVTVFELGVFRREQAAILSLVAERRVVCDVELIVVDSATDEIQKNTIFSLRVRDLISDRILLFGLGLSGGKNESHRPSLFSKHHASFDPGYFIAAVKPFF